MTLKRVGCAVGEAYTTLLTQHPDILPDGAGKVAPGNNFQEAGKNISGGGETEQGADQAQEGSRISGDFSAISESPPSSPGITSHFLDLGQLNSWHGLNLVYTQISATEVQKFSIKTLNKNIQLKTSLLCLFLLFILLSSIKPLT